MMSEGDRIGWEFSTYDIEEEERREAGDLDNFEFMLLYHDLSEDEFSELSENDKSRCWANFKILGAEKTDEYESKINSMIAQHSENRAAKIGAIIKCACGCGEKIVKKSYQTQFYRNKGKGNCKDRYYNNTDEKRRMLAKLINAGT